MCRFNVYVGNISLCVGVCVCGGGGGYVRVCMHILIYIRSLAHKVNG